MKNNAEHWTAMGAAILFCLGVWAVVVIVATIVAKIQ